EMRVPVKVVVDRMIDAAAVFSSETEIDAGNAVVLQERGVVGAGTERRDAQVGALAGFGRMRVGDLTELIALPRGKFRLGIGDVFRDFIGEFFERVRTLDE